MAQAKLVSIMQAADALTVGTIAQEPFCVEPDRPLRETYTRAREEDFDWLPVRGPDRRILALVETRNLAELESWGQVEDQARPIKLEQVIAKEAPIFSALERIEKNGFLLTLGREGVEGIVTAFDLNQPAAHYVGFAMAIFIESEIARFLSDEYRSRGHSDTKIEELAKEANVSEESIRKWRAARGRSEQLALVPWLSFTEKRKLLQRAADFEAFARRCVSHYATPDAALARLPDDLGEVIQLRNDVAHDKPSLTDHRVVCRRLRLARDLAHALSRSA